MSGFRPAALTPIGKRIGQRIVLRAALYRLSYHDRFGASDWKRYVSESSSFQAPFSGQGHPHR